MGKKPEWGLVNRAEDVGDIALKNNTVTGTTALFRMIMWIKYSASCKAR